MNVTLLHYELEKAGLPVSGVSSDGRIDYSRELTNEEQAVAAAVIAAHSPAGLLPQEQLERDAITGYGGLPDWARTATADSAAEYITGEIWQGQSAVQVDAWIDANLTNITTANIAQINARLAVIRQALKLAAGAIITMRGLFVLTSKLLLYIRDLVIRFRQAG